jgi:U3 small nucleolar ribonucleoprotein protein IMP4
MPTEFKKHKDDMMKDLDLADDKTIVARSHIDDEYEEAKYRDPKILITTSRSPS